MHVLYSPLWHVSKCLYHFRSSWDMTPDPICHPCASSTYTHKNLSSGLLQSDPPFSYLPVGYPTHIRHYTDWPTQNKREIGQQFPTCMIYRPNVSLHSSGHRYSSRTRKGLKGKETQILTEIQISAHITLKKTKILVLFQWPYLNIYQITNEIISITTTAPYFPVSSVPYPIEKISIAGESDASVVAFFNTGSAPLAAFSPPMPLWLSCLPPDSNDSGTTAFGS